MKIYAYADPNIEADVYDTGKTIETKLKNIVPDAYMASVFPIDNSNWAISFYVEEYPNLKKVTNYLRNLPAFKKVTSEECGEDCFYVYCYMWEI